MSKKEKLSVKNIVIFILAAAAFIFIMKNAVSCAKNSFGTVSAEQAAVFLKERGFEIDESYYDEREITIPAEFSEVYSRYAEILAEGGWDLTKYRGEKVKRYTFKVLNFKGNDGEISDNSEAHVLVRGGEIIGGDVCSASLGGKIESI